MAQGKKINQFFIDQIEDLMLNHGMANKPSLIENYFRKISGFNIGKTGNEYIDNLKVDDKVREIYNQEDYPKLPTIKEHMHNIRKNGIKLQELRVPFSWPIHIGNGEYQIPEAHARYAMDAADFYLREFPNLRLRPPTLGLIKRFAQVTSVSQHPEGMTDQIRAIIAESLWYADLIDSNPYKKRPSTRYEELFLIKKAWADSFKGPDLGGVGMIIESETGIFRKDVREHRLIIPKEDFGYILTYLPLYRKAVIGSIYYKETAGIDFDIQEFVNNIYMGGNACMYACVCCEKP